MNNAFWGGAFIACLALYFLKQAVKDLKDYDISKEWPSVEGTILKSEAVRWKVTSSHTTLFVEYKYDVDGSSYTGRRSALYTHTREEVLECVERFKVGAVVPVYYKSDAPSEALLITGGREDKRYSKIILSLFVSAVGGAVAIAGYMGFLDS